MRTFIFFMCGLFIATGLLGQTGNGPAQTKVMTLGVFHFAYHNLDVVKTEKKNQISVFDEPYQSEIVAISKAIEDFKPTIIAIEQAPDQQYKIDSLYLQYKAGRYALEKNEIDQLGFRIGKDLDLPNIYCVNDWGRHYDNITSMFKDSLRLSKFDDYYTKLFGSNPTVPKVTSIIDELNKANNPDSIKDDLSGYLDGMFKYEEKPNDFTGVDFQTGRWFNRNLRIFRNIQRIPHSNDDRILLIIGSGHLNLLNYFFEVSKEFEFISPLPYLKNAKR
ncbi:DUF5694 domain-containing protein [uncultured Acetobacteroides sp.]|uniref:DUF5694 domain-containing protein n=1 Tax=uncultured Acetobacteroides sp. TaxID=1760811 RepID=UPI0029F5099F|nr:DUF5694 domain-containing protein [uncultured Acetobacteroides sp.]